MALSVVKQARIFPPPTFFRALYTNTYTYKHTGSPTTQSTPLLPSCSRDIILAASPCT